MKAVWEITKYIVKKHCDDDGKGEQQGKLRDRSEKKAEIRR